MRSGLSCRLRAAAICALVLFVGLSGIARAEPRIALVVGNGAYGTVTPLDNPIADANAVAETLEARGFSVTLLTDADQVTFNRAIAQFGRDLRSGGNETTGLFYYAGHAVQSFGANYLLPTDVALTDAADLGLVAVRADAILRQMASAANRANIVILDACRNNPFSNIPDMNDNGLAEMKAPTGTFMAYSTAPGSVALDGTGDNSPFTEAMVAEMQVPGQNIEQMFKQVRARVLEASHDQQTPWDTSSLTTEIQFTPGTEDTAAGFTEARIFESIEKSRDPVQIVLFLQSYPDSVHTEAAKRLLVEALDAEEAKGGSASEALVAALKPPSPATSPVQGKVPSEEERGLISTAQSTGAIEDYRAYLEAYPDGVFAELAATEIATRAAKDPEAPAGGLAAAILTAPPETKAETSPPAALDVTMDTPLPLDDPALAGKSIAQLIGGTPRYPPIENLPEELWKGQPCSNCHQWHQESLCTQAQTYIAASGTRALGKEHPYGGGFKRVLRDWANGGCR